jgi:hypothetical protein
VRNRFFFVWMTMITLFSLLGQRDHAEAQGGARINWVEGYVSAIGEGTTSQTGNKLKDKLRALRTATLLAQRALLETVKGIRIDSHTRVENIMLKEDVINSRVEGVIYGSEIVKQDVQWEGEVPIATVEIRVCLSEGGSCKSGKSILSALDLDQKIEPPNVPPQKFDETVGKQYTMMPKIQGIIYDSSKTVTGMVLNLQGRIFERVILPVVITTGEGDKRFTVYSAKSVEPQIIRTYGVVRYADSVEQAQKNPYLGDNAVIVPVSGVTKDNIIIVGIDAARIIRETTSHGNDYLRNAKVIIAAK